MFLHIIPPIEWDSCVILCFNRCLLTCVFRFRVGHASPELRMFDRWSPAVMPLRHCTAMERSPRGQGRVESPQHVSCIYISLLLTDCHAEQSWRFIVIFLHFPLPFLFTTFTQLHVYRYFVFVCPWWILLWGYWFPLSGCLHTEFNDAGVSFIPESAARVGPLPIPAPEPKDIQEIASSVGAPRRQAANCLLTDLPWIWPMRRKLRRPMEDHQKLGSLIHKVVRPYQIIQGHLHAVHLGSYSTNTKRMCFVSQTFGYKTIFAHRAPTSELDRHKYCIPRQFRCFWHFIGRYGHP